MMHASSSVRAALSIVVPCLLAGCSSSSSTSPSSDAGAPDSPVDATSDVSGGGTSLTGTLGNLGPAQPIATALWFSTSTETITYLTSAAVTCDQLKGANWIASLPAGSQVVEIIVKGQASVGDHPVPPAEVNYAPGGQAVSETKAMSGTISFTRADAQILEGTLTATYANGSVQGTFHAVFCSGGQEW